ncbi:MAG: hypothetical protein HY293_14845 [Planctomycetes bacterium]|nr:hypothetical protein [Planctomycetota bacterium]
MKKLLAFALPAVLAWTGIPQDVRGDAFDPKDVVQLVAQSDLPLDPAGQAVLIRVIVGLDRVVQRGEIFQAASKRMVDRLGALAAAAAEKAQEALQKKAEDLKSKLPHMLEEGLTADGHEEIRGDLGALLAALEAATDQMIDPQAAAEVLNALKAAAKQGLTKAGLATVKALIRDLVRALQDGPRDVFKTLVRIQRALPVLLQEGLSPNSAQLIADLIGKSGASAVQNLSDLTQAALEATLDAIKAAARGAMTAGGLEALKAGLAAIVHLVEQGDEEPLIVLLTALAGSIEEILKSVPPRIARKLRRRMLSVANVLQ